MAVDMMAPGAKEVRFKQALWPLTENKALSRTVALPASPTDGDVYIIYDSHPTQAGQIAFRYLGAWEYVVPELGWKCFIIDEVVDVWYDGSGWIETEIGIFVGDSGTGGIEGLVPAPLAGDYALGAYLSAGGSFLPVGSIFVTYDNTVSGLTADTVKDALDELAAMGGGGGGGTLDGLSDVNAPSPTNGQLLTWDSTPGEWVAADPAPAGASSLDELTDVTVPTPADGDVLTFDSGSGEWIAAPQSGGTTESAEWSLTLAASDETTDLTTGDSKITFFMPTNVTVTEIFIGVAGQSSSGNVTIDLRKNGTTVFSTPPSIQALEDTSLTGTVAVISNGNFVKGDKIEIDIDAAGTGANGLKVTIIGTIIVTTPDASEITFNDASCALVQGADVQAALEDVDSHISETRIAFYIGGTALAASEELFVYIVKKAFSLPSGLTGSGVKSGVAATGTPAIDIKKNGANIGTATWAAAGTTATLALASTTAFAVDDILSLVGPSTADATLARIYGTLVGDYT